MIGFFFCLIILFHILEWLIPESKKLNHNEHYDLYATEGCSRCMGEKMIVDEDGEEKECPNCNGRGFVEVPPEAYKPYDGTF
ncbi:MAG TPA: hypothetical protein ENN28_03375 [Candidatus Uhrbacteria bacterium]|nr:hypothetical protein [Candidatus Uhrbacteria bacterium]